MKKIKKRDVILLCRAIDTALKNNDKIFFNNYNSSDREDGTPTHESFIGINGNSCDWEENAKSRTENCIQCSLPETPEYYGDGCNDLVIVDKSNNYYYVWYSDNHENRIYLDDIQEYLSCDYDKHGDY